MGAKATKAKPPAEARCSPDDSSATRWSPPDEETFSTPVGSPSWLLNEESNEAAESAADTAPPGPDNDPAAAHEQSQSIYLDTDQPPPIDEPPAAGPSEQPAEPTAGQVEPQSDRTGLDEPPPVSGGPIPLPPPDSSMVAELSAPCQRPAPVDCPDHAATPGASPAATPAEPSPSKTEPESDLDFRLTNTSEPQGLSHSLDGGRPVDKQANCAAGRRALAELARTDDTRPEVGAERIEDTARPAANDRQPTMDDNDDDDADADGDEEDYDARTAPETRSALVVGSLPPTGELLLDLSMSSQDEDASRRRSEPASATRGGGRGGDDDDARPTLIGAHRGRGRGTYYRMRWSDGRERWCRLDEAERVAAHLLADYRRNARTLYNRLRSRTKRSPRKASQGSQR
jgi:hypothetical protein